MYKYNLLIENYSTVIKSTIEENKTVLIKGPTGCGKSTYVPLLLDFNDKKIAIIEPRRIAVTSLYNTLHSVVGSKVGYKMRFNKRIEKDTNVVIYTDGAFLNDAKHKHFDYIILDEVHERSIRTDVILSILKKGESKVILMSATVDTNKIQRYCDAKVVEIEGSSYPARIIYNEEPVSDYIIEAYTIIKGIVLDDKKKKEILKKEKKINYRTAEDDVDDFLEINKPREEIKIDNPQIEIETDNKDILVFLTGEEDINELYKLLKRILNISIYKIYSSLSDSDQSKIYEESPLRKVILSTNICETSLTIPGIRYVLDCGLAKTKLFDKIDYMGILSISKESAEQRMGRCNRTGPGVCYRIYPREIYEKMTCLIPEIKRADLTNAVLQLASFDINIFECDLLDYPTQSNVFYAISFLLRKKLIYLIVTYKNKIYRIENGTIVECKNNKKLNISEERTKKLLESVFDLKMNIKITNFGRIISSLPFDVNLACFYQECLTKKVSYYGSMLVAMISLNNYNFVKSSKNNKTDIEHLVGLFEDYLGADNKVQFCKEREVSQKFLEKASNVFNKLDKKKGGDISSLEKVFSSSFEYNKSIKNNDGSYTHIESGKKVYIHPSSGFFKKNEKYIVFVDVLCTTKEYVRVVGRYFSQ
ncbi:ATP-dependent RNA helicase dhx8 [Nosema granulosis]|uniref:ATP-dependent RNA helicase dhx8 n=1 Tax=Nosema granulosis TaxID=83296 RepID=A0A9P6H2H1_9MICR|nr:ATP-dependent RNA helicase dhx8 [Nosema granulosis]